MIIRLLILAMLIAIYFRLGDVVSGVRFFDARLTNIEMAKP